MKNRTFGDANDIGGNGPRIGPLVISEVMYKPSVSGSEVADDFEYIEICNPTDSPVSLANWRIASGITFAFASTTTIAAHEAVVILPFDPSLSANATKLAAFKTKYGVGSSIQLLGPYSGKLSDSGETVQLLRPGDPDGTPPTYPGLLEDEVAYGIASPWPAAANGGGSSLQRIAADVWGDSAASWAAATPTVGAAKVSSVVGRWLFYDNSAYDGLVAGVNGADDLAIAIDKRALLPGQTATAANYTNYSGGINGLMVDLRSAAGESLIDLSDFQFRVGNDSNPGSWTLLTGSQLPTLVLRAGAGVDGTDRVEFVWNDASAIKNQWLQVTVLATEHTGLRSADVFYVGNLVGETGNVAGEASVTVLDEQQARAHRSNFSLVDVSNAYDFNRDRKVNAADEYIARTNSGASLTMLTVAAAAAEESAPVAETSKPAADSSAPADEETVETSALASEAPPTSEIVQESSSAPVADLVPNAAQAPSESAPIVETTSEIVLATVANEPKASTVVESTETTAFLESEKPVARKPMNSIPLQHASMPVFTAPAHAEYFATVAGKAKSAKSMQIIESIQWSVSELQLTAKVKHSDVHKAHEFLFDEDAPFQLIRGRTDL
jgi:hypothetical protein